MPPVVASCRVVVLPAHKLSVPVMIEGEAFTVIVLETMHPDGEPVEPSE
jgi:hypothetical protein